MSSSRYGISAVQYDSDDRNRIANVKAHAMSLDDKLSGVGIYPREAVIQAIEEKGITLVTLPTAFDGKYTVGPAVVTVTIQNETYLKTTEGENSQGENPHDSLGQLPEF